MTSGFSIYALEAMGFREVIDKGALAASFMSVTVYEAKGLSLPVGFAEARLARVAGTEYRIALSTEVNMTSIGTLFAFILVCAGIMILRKSDPDIPRQFKTPFVPLVPILGIIVCSAMIYGLGWTNWTRLLIWLVIGFVIYFLYSRKHSKLRNKS